MVKKNVILQKLLPRIMPQPESFSKQRIIINLPFMLQCIMINFL